VPDLLVDTDVFVDHLRGAQRLEVGDHAVQYSAMTRVELFAGHATDEERVNLLLSPFREIPLDRPIAERAGRLRRDARVPIADAVIAATALERGCILVTRNTRHFQGIADLTVQEPSTR
jgi:predicted nucleic acid-binding protein